MDLNIDVISEDVEQDEGGQIYKPSELITIRGSGNMNIFGLSNRFNSEFPTELISKIAPEEFKSTISRVNSILSKTVPINAKWLICGCFCCFCTLGCSFFPVVCLNKRVRQNSLDSLLTYLICIHLFRRGCPQKNCWSGKTTNCTTSLASIGESRNNNAQQIH